jgi:hypothetical protein
VPNLSANLLFVSQLTQTCKIVEFWLDRFYVHDLKKGKSIVVVGFSTQQTICTSFVTSTRPEPELTTLVAHTDERSRIWHERLRHLNFRSLQTLETQNMVVGLS